jgi:hypothetical protein
MEEAPAGRCAERELIARCGILMIKPELILRRSTGIAPL